MRGVKARRVKRALRHLGFVPLGGRGRGSHEFWRHPDGRVATVSEKRGLVPPGTFHAIIRQAGVSKEEFERHME